SGIDFRIKGEQVVLKRGKKKKEDENPDARENQRDIQRAASYFRDIGSRQQQRVITGKVVNESGEGLVGVNVVVQGSLIGTTTDIDGMYSISVPDDATVLIFSFIGYI